MFCWLCVKDADDGKLLLSGAGQPTEIYRIAALYFPHEMDEIKPKLGIRSHWLICSDCWKHIWEFHEFHNAIVEAHKRLEHQPLEHVDELLKTESDAEDEVHLLADPVAVDVPHLDQQQQHQQPKKTRRTKSRRNTVRKTKDGSSDEELYTGGQSARKPKREQTQEHDEFIAKHWKDKLSCDLCREVRCNTFGDLYAHFRAHHGNATAYVVCCQRKFFHRSYFVDHLQVHLNSEYFKCDKCEKCFTNRRYFNDHQKNGHAVLERRYECEVCHKRFAKKTILRGHMDIHVEGSKDYVCADCGKGFVLKSRYEAHVRNVHAERTVCELCGKSIRDRYVLAKHLLEHQGVEKPLWPCDLCDAKLHSKYSLGRHKRVAHSDGSTCYVCSECGKVSMSEEALRSHKKHVHQKERKHKCTICGKAFKVAIILKEHMTTHTGVDLYQCPHCPKTFKVSANMHHHRKRMHPNEWAANRRRRNPSTTKPVDLKHIENEIVL